MALVLDRRTALVSPQFHVHFDPGIKTVKQDGLDSLWQLKAGFVSQKELQVPATNTAIDSSPANKRKDIQWDLPSEGEGNPVAKKSCTRNDRFQQENEESLQQTDLNRTKDLPMAPAKEPEPVEPLIKAMMAEIRVHTAKEVGGEIFCLEAMYPFREDNEHPLIAFKATLDPDTMYLHEAMRQLDKVNFIEAMSDKVKAFNDNVNWKLLHRSKVPQGTPILPAVWQMKRKRIELLLGRFINGRLASTSTAANKSKGSTTGILMPQ